MKNVIGVIALLLVASPAHAQLKPLKYNNPGLEVDLGVGLWAWPLPMDFDGDGDMDLVVSCPDKPSNGLYYFENPTQDPSVKLPAFKAGVRLGPTGQNVQVSYVDGKPRVLKENIEFPDFKNSGLGQGGQKVYERALFHRGDTRARMWRYVALTLRDGRHLLLYNHIPGARAVRWGRRNGLHLAVSDDGKVWKAVTVIEKADNGDFSYPAMIQTADGRVHLTFTWNRKQVKHVVIDPVSIKVGKVLGTDAW